MSRQEPGKSEKKAEEKPSTSDNKSILLVIIPVISGLVGTAIGAILQGYFNVELERQKFEFSLIQKALDTSETDDAAKRLIFLIDSGVIKSLDSDKIKSIAETEPSKLPTLTVSELDPTNSGCSISSTVRELDRQIVYLMLQIDPSSLVDITDLNISFPAEYSFPLLQPAAKEALSRAIKKRNATLRINAAYRSITAQHLLRKYAEEKKCGIQVAAIPGRSNHQTGTAIDISDAEGWRPYLEAEGWRWFGRSDRVHFDYVGSERKDIRELPIRAFQKLWNLNNPNNKISENGVYDSETSQALDKSPSRGFTKGEKF